MSITTQITKTAEPTADPFFFRIHHLPHAHVAQNQHFMQSEFNVVSFPEIKAVKPLSFLKALTPYRTLRVLFVIQFSNTEGLS